MSKSCATSDVGTMMDVAALTSNVMRIAAYARGRSDSYPDCAYAPVEAELKSAWREMADLLDEAIRDGDRSEVIDPWPPR